jgi:hypothetical protein
MTIQEFLPDNLSPFVPRGAMHVSFRAFQDNEKARVIRMETIKYLLFEDQYCTGGEAGIVKLFNHDRITEACCFQEWFRA